MTTKRRTLLLTAAFILAGVPIIFVHHYAPDWIGIVTGFTVALVATLAYEDGRRAQLEPDS